MRREIIPLGLLLGHGIQRFTPSLLVVPALDSVSRDPAEEMGCIRTGFIPSPKPPRAFIQKAHFAGRQAADNGSKSLEVADIEKPFTNIGVDATASTGEPDTFDTY